MDADSNPASGMNYLQQSKFENRTAVASAKTLNKGFYIT
jgi:hypothetical protein